MTGPWGELVPGDAGDGRNDEKTGKLTQGKYLQKRTRSDLGRESERFMSAVMREHRKWQTNLSDTVEVT
jgi:hypothetical protein